MKAKIAVPPLGWLAKLADVLMVPLMYLASGTFKEIPQRGHKWNRVLLTETQVESLDNSGIVHCKGIPSAMRSRWLFLYHIPILGGWRDYVTLEPESPNKEWFIGFIADMKGVSQIKLTGRVRMTIGRGDASFFGIDAHTFEQIPIRSVSRGRIGEGGLFAKEKLL